MQETRTSYRRMKSRRHLSVLVWSLALVSALASPLQQLAHDVFESNETQPESEPASYGVLLDTGSSSTKLKIYRWTKPDTNPGVPNITLVHIPKKQRKFKPGLAKLDGHSDRTKEYLLPILEAAKENIPASQHADTPIFVLATAGFRLIGLDAARRGMEAVEAILMNFGLHPFKYTAGSASVLSGEEEAAYSWIAANYLTGFFHDNRADSESVGVLEMGGGSTQIAFIPRDPLLAEEFQVILAGRRYSLYVQSYLKFGLNAVRNQLESDLVKSSNNCLDEVDQPCMLSDDTKNVTHGNTNIMLRGTGDPIECRRLYDKLVASAPPRKCYLEPCAIGSVFQPSVEGIDFYAISAFMYSLKAVGAVDADGTLDLSILWTKAQEYCLQDISEIPEKGRNFASANCMEAIYTNELFTKPYGFSVSSSRIKATNELNGNDIEWPLGAMLELLSLSFTGDPNHCSLTRK